MRMYLGRKKKGKMTLGWEGWWRREVMLDYSRSQGKNKEKERNRTLKFLVEKDLPVFYVVSPGCEVC